MRRSEGALVHVISVLVVGLGLAIARAQVAYTDQRRPTPAHLPGWLAGCWEAHTPSDTLEEYWMTPRAATMLGVARLVRGDSVVTYEQNRIEVRGNRTVLVSISSTRPGRQYAATELDSRIARFESRDSVTERVRYERRGDSLFVRFSYHDGGGNRDVEQPMTAVVCPHDIAPLR